jgi:site-specific DNA-adenine methylase
MGVSEDTYYSNYSSYPDTYRTNKEL